MIFDKKICIFGTGGFGREVLCCLKDAIANDGANIEDIACFMVSEEYLTEEKIMGVDVLSLSKFDPTLYHVVVAIGDPESRKSIVQRLPSSTTYATIIHPSAVISDWVEVGAGSVITAGVILTCNIKIGNHAHLNLHTTVGHDCVIGDFFTTAPAVNVSGNCQFGDCVYLGTNAAVKQGVEICNNVTIGMGGIVVKNIEVPGVYIGNPVRKLDKK